MSDSLQSHGLQHIRLLCLLPSPKACSNMYPLSCPWCYLTISSSASPFSSCLHSFPASGYFPVSWLFPLGGKSIGASVSVLLIEEELIDWMAWSPLGLNGLISLLSKGLSRFFASTASQNHQFFSTHPSLWSKSHICIWQLETL